jgi:PAS domain S-box-containing protein
MTGYVSSLLRGNRSGLLSGICAIIVCGLGFSALLGWVFKLPFLTSFDSGKIPMAPSTALLFILYGTILFLYATLLHRGRGIYLISILVHLTGVLVALVLVVLNYRDIHPAIEHFGFSILKNMPAHAHSGHMSPVTAGCFILSSLSFFLLFFASPTKRCLVYASVVPSALLLMISFVLTLAYWLGMPLLYGSAIIPPALPTSLAFMAMGIALLAFAWSYFLSAELFDRSTVILVGVFIVLTVGVLTAGFFIYRAYAQHYRTEAEHQLSAITELKEWELQQWRRERFWDAEIIYGNPVFVELVRRYFKRPLDQKVEQQLESWLMQFIGHVDYDKVNLFDLRGLIRLSLPVRGLPVSAIVLRRAAEVVQSKQITLVDFYRDERDQQIYLALLIPVIDTLIQNRVIGVVALQIDPRKYLYPILLHWPTPSKTAETLLVRQEGNDVLFLSELKFIKNAALNFRIPLNMTEVTTVMAVVGRTGVVEGVDYRNVSDIAEVRPVHGSSWFLESRMELSEVYAPVKPHLWMIVGFVVALIVGSGAFLAFVWRKQSVEHYRKQAQTAEALRESEEIFKKFMELSPIYVFFKNDQIRSLRLSKNFETMLGKPMEELLGKTMDELFPSDFAKKMIADDLMVLKSGKTFETEEELNGRQYRTIKFPIYYEGAPKYLAGYTIDITARKRAEAELLTAKKAAEKSAQSKAMFLDIAAHELRNPTTAISLLLQIIQKQVEKGQPISAATFARLHEPVERLTRLVVDLLDVSRLDRGLMVLQPVRSDIVLLVSKCVEEFKLQAPKRRFSFLSPEQLIEVDIDPVRIYQVLSNLLDNAVKYTPEDRPIEVTLSPMLNIIRISVIDQGDGIPKEQLHNLFKAFSRGGGVTGRVGGLGLGLSVCRGIVELHGGRIGVLSEVGRGSTFYFELPRRITS